MARRPTRTALRPSFINTVDDPDLDDQGEIRWLLRFRLRRSMGWMW